MPPSSRRYIRQTILPGWGEEGQAKLRNAKVLVIGAGGIGSPALLYLAAAGVGTIGIVDSDRVELSNLHRQIIHETSDIGRAKVESAKDALEDLNPEVKIITHGVRLGTIPSPSRGRDREGVQSCKNITPTPALPLEGEGEIDSILSAYDLILDGSDNFETRFLVNDACYRLKKPLVSAALGRFEGQLSIFKAYLGEPHPCYRCLYPELPPPGTIPPCSENGVLPSLAGILGSWASAEIIKEIIDMGNSLSGRLLLVDALAATARTITLPRDPACPCCGR